MFRYSCLYEREPSLKMVTVYRLETFNDTKYRLVFAQRQTLASYDERVFIFYYTIIV